MMGFHLLEVYYILHDAGLTRSKRDLSRALDRHWSYVRDVEQRDRDEFQVPLATVERLRTLLQALIPFLSKGSAAEVERIVSRIDQHTAVTLALRRVDRNPGSKSEWTSNW